MTDNQAEAKVDADWSAPPFADNGIGGLMFKGGHAYLDEYVLSTEGDDHEPTEFERVLLEDFMAGILNDDAMFGPVRALLADHAAQAEEIASQAALITARDEGLAGYEEQISAQSLHIASLEATLEYVEDRLHEINPSNYDHDDVLHAVRLGRLTATGIGRSLLRTSWQECPGQTHFDLKRGACCYADHFDFLRLPGRRTY